MKHFAQAIFYVIMFIFTVALVKIIMEYIYWDSKTIFTAGAILMTAVFIPSVFFYLRETSKIRRPALIIISSILVSVISYLAGVTSLFGSFFPNYWIAILLQAIALGILSMITTERKTITIIWVVWMAYSIVLMAMHLVNKTL